MKEEFNKEGYNERLYRLEFNRWLYLRRISKYHIIQTLSFREFCNPKYSTRELPITENVILLLKNNRKKEVVIQLPKNNSFNEIGNAIKNSVLPTEDITDDLILRMFLFDRSVTKNDMDEIVTHLQRQEANNGFRLLHQLIDESDLGEPLELNSTEFFLLAKKKAPISKIYADKGVYCLINKNNDKRYVGKSRNLFRRVKQHFTGRGNPQLFVDWSNGDEFTIKLFLFDFEKRFQTLKEMEEFFITKFNVIEFGYNKQSVKKV